MKKTAMPTNQELKLRCTRWISGHPPQSQQAWLSRLAQSPPAEPAPDVYGEGPAVARLEAEVAGLLGKEAAVFMHKGVVAQQCALRVWTDRTGRRTVALHPRSHIAADEGNAYERLHNLIGLPVGQDWAPFTVRDLEALAEPLGAVTVELPLRRAGFKLPSWAELTDIAAWARDHRVPLHIDGARLWESGPFYGRSYAEIAALADSIYVSFYKGLGGLAGCILAGPADFLAAARVWQTRMGGNLYTVFPYVIAAGDGLAHHLPKMAGYRARAQEVAAALAGELGLRVAPDPPHTNAFQVFLPQPAGALEQAGRIIAEQDQAWLLGWLVETALPGVTMTEIQIGEAAEAWRTEEIVAAFRRLLDLAAQQPLQAQQ